MESHIRISFLLRLYGYERCIKGILYNYNK